MLNRREFVYSLGALALAPPAALLASGATDKTPEPLTTAEKETLGHICETLIPEDDYPGALELGVVTYIDRLLKEAHPDWIVVYRTGLAATDQACEELFEQPFAKLDAARQTEVVEKMQRGQLPGILWRSVPSGEFFSMVLSHTMQGFYSHPQWGGNKNKEAWKMIGYDDWWA